ncbi:unnamed protein product [Darwinula stevensoni]|uniref:C2H2-type domain-containing protein n=1 Tax=Darwinula stevensoni TaxID=69355 RepID=A0A7R9AB36_9CRUS|nr:unnamed protein product [Darwinula stevensoni]CAG0899038.1 unnamed protein product [Darwinula stevensoni]
MAAPTPAPRPYHCASCELYFDSATSLHVHRQYHKENLLALWAKQSGPIPSEDDNNNMGEDTSTSPAPSHPPRAGKDGSAAVKSPSVQGDADQGQHGFPPTRVTSSPPGSAYSRLPPPEYPGGQFQQYSHPNIYSQQQRFGSGHYYQGNGGNWGVNKHDEQAENEDSAAILDLDTNKLHVYQDRNAGDSSNPIVPVGKGVESRKMSPLTTERPPQGYQQQMPSWQNPAWNSQQQIPPPHQGWHQPHGHPQLQQTYYSSYGNSTFSNPSQGPLSSLQQMSGSPIYQQAPLRPSNMPDAFQSQWYGSGPRPNGNLTLPPSAGPNCVPEYAATSTARSTYMKTSDDGESDWAQSPSSPDYNPKDDKRLRPFACTVCDKHFIRKGHLNRHLTTAAHKNRLSAIAQGTDSSDCPPSKVPSLDNSSSDSSPPPPPHVPNSIGENVSCGYPRISLSSDDYIPNDPKLITSAPGQVPRFDDCPTSPPRLAFRELQPIMSNGRVEEKHELLSPSPKLERPSSTSMSNESMPPPAPLGSVTPEPQSNAFPNRMYQVQPSPARQSPVPCASPQPVKAFFTPPTTPNGMYNPPTAQLYQSSQEVPLGPSSAPGMQHFGQRTYPVAQPLPGMMPQYQQNQQQHFQHVGMMQQHQPMFQPRPMQYQPPPPQMPDAPPPLIPPQQPFRGVPLSPMPEPQPQYQPQMQSVSQTPETLDLPPSPGDQLFVCGICSKRSSSEAIHVEHMAAHNGDKPFKCQQCPKQFNHKTDLRRHLCLHTGERPFTCLTCGKKFIRKDHMTKHEDVHRKPPFYE